MKNRELVIRRIDQIDSGINSMKFLLSRNSNKEEFTSYLDKNKELIEDLKQLVEREPLAPHEQNRV